MKSFLYYQFPMLSFKQTIENKDSLVLCQTSKEHKGTGRIVLDTVSLYNLEANCKRLEVRALFLERYLILFS